MEVKGGYKQTEVGLIPLDWKAKSVQELGQIKTGPFGTLLKAREYSTGDGVPLISVGEIGVGLFRITNDTPRVPQTVLSRLPQYILRTGDIVFGRKGAVDRSALVTLAEDGFFLGSDGIRLRPASGCHPPYLAAQFQSRRVQAWLLQNAIGTTMASLNQAVLHRAQIPIAPLNEQCAIATALSEVDELLEGLDRLIAKKCDLKQAAMQQLLTGETRLTGFRDEWRPLKFSDLTSPSHSRIDPSRSQPHEFCVELEHIDQGTGRLLGWSATTPQSSLKSTFDTGDVLFGKLRAYLRKYWLADRPGVCSTEIWVLKPKPDTVTSGYLYQLVTMDRFIDAASTAYGTHMPRSDWKVVRELELSVPPRAEQDAIATALGDMDAEIEAVEQRRAKTADLKQAMMQELLTGKTRLVVPEANHA